MDILIILVVLVLIFGGGFGYYGSSRANYGPAVSWSPLVGLIVILVILRLLHVI